MPQTQFVLREENKFGRLDLVFFLSLNLGGNNYSEAAAYIKNRFAAQCDTDSDGWPIKHIYVYYVCATDTHNVHRVFTSVVDDVTKDAMEFGGITP